MTTEQRIFNLLAKFDTLTSDDRKAIKAMCAEAGISAKFETGCQQCYTDALLQLKVHYGVKSPVWSDVKHITESGNYEMNVQPCDWHLVGQGMVHIDLSTPDNIIEDVLKYHPHMFTKVKKEAKK